MRDDIIIVGAVLSLIGGGLAVASMAARNTEPATLRADMPGWSPFSVAIDHRTGCQYLVTARAEYFLPRVDAAGKHICGEAGK